MQDTANKQKRITLKTIHQMLDGMSVELVEKVHLLFMKHRDRLTFPLAVELNLLSLRVWRCNLVSHKRAELEACFIKEKNRSWYKQ